MDAKRQKTESEQTELLSNLVFIVAKLQRQLEKRSVSEFQDHELDSSSMTSADSNVSDDVSEFLTAPSRRDSIVENTFLTDVEGLYEENRQFGDKVDDQLAGLVNKAIGRPLKEDTAKELASKYLTPINCQRLDVPTVNKELWSALKDKREGDLALQAVQKSIKLALVPTIHALEVLKTDGNIEKLQEFVKDIFKVLAHGIYTCNRKRKPLIKPGIPSKYRKVCDMDIPVTSNLFGDDLEGKVDEIEKQEKRVNKLGGSKPPFLWGKSAQRGTQPWKDNFKGSRTTDNQGTWYREQNYRGKSSAPPQKRRRIY